MASPVTDHRYGFVWSNAVKTPVTAATTTDITLNGEQTVDGVACVTGDRVLVKDQTDGVENGIYSVDTGDWTRAKDFDGRYDIVTGTVIRVLYGTQTGWWGITTTGTLTIGTTSLTFARDSVTVTATASLPAAGTSQNGLILIEDAGAGDRNLIIYAGGQRFRIDGGAAF